MTSSWVDPEEVAIRDDGAEAVPAVDEAQALSNLEKAIAVYRETPAGDDKLTAAGLLRLAAQAPLGHGAVDARPPWPKDAVVWVRPIAPAGSIRDINKRTLRAVDGTVEHLWYESGIATLAAMVTRVEGEVFKDRDGNLLAFTGSFEQRVAAVEKLPNFVQVYVSGEINRRSEEDPFGLGPKPSRRTGKSTSR